MAKSKKAAKKAQRPAAPAPEQSPAPIAEQPSSEQSPGAGTGDAQLPERVKPEGGEGISAAVEDALKDLTTAVPSEDSTNSGDGASKAPSDVLKNDAPKTTKHESAPETSEPQIDSPAGTRSQKSASPDPSESGTVADPAASTAPHTEPVSNGSALSSKSGAGSGEETRNGAAADGKVAVLEAELAELREQLEAVETERDDTQEELDSLRENVKIIRTRLTEHYEKLKAETDQAKAETAAVRSELQSAQNDVKVARAEAEAARKEVQDAKSAAEQLTLQHQQSLLESDALKRQLVSQKVMFDQEVQDERAIKDALELELAQARAALEAAQSLAGQSTATARAQEEKIASLEAKLKAVSNDAEQRASAAVASQEEAQAALAQAQADLKQVRAQLAALSESSHGSSKRQNELEDDVKQKQLLIGKLRHEAVILNDHLTHALRLVRQDSEGSSVDKDLVSNLFVQYATVPRGDTKKYEILMLIANFLDWDERRRQLVGLSKQPEPERDAAQAQPQMVGMVGKLAEFLESRRSSSS